MTKPIITRTANLGPVRIDHDLVRRVLALKEAAWEDVRVERKGA